MCSTEFQTNKDNKHDIITLLSFENYVIRNILRIRFQRNRVIRNKEVQK